jgi:hypothetical protein
LNLTIDMNADCTKRLNCRKRFNNRSEHSSGCQTPTKQLRFNELFDKTKNYQIDPSNTFPELTKSNSRMIGDMSGEHALELTSGPREKLKYISKETMLDFINNGHDLMSGLESHSIWMESLEII